MGYTVVFTATSVSVVHPDGQSILDGWGEAAGAGLWRFPLKPVTPGEAQETPVEVQETQSVTFALLNNHVNKDSSQWRKAAGNLGLSGVVLPDQVET